MPNKFKVPFLKSKRNSLAIDLTLSANKAAECANKSTTISDFISNYDIILDCFSKLSKLNGKVSSVHGDLSAEYYRLLTDFQEQLYKAIDRIGDEIVSGYKGLYKYDSNHTEQCIRQFKSDIGASLDRFDKRNTDFAYAKVKFVCNECGMADLLTQKNTENIDEIDDLFEDAVNCVLETGQASVSMLQRKLDIDYSRASRIINQMEMAGIIGSIEGSKPREILVTQFDWQCMRSSHSLACCKKASFILEEIDNMGGHEFEHWCACLLRQNGFYDVAVTQGSGDQGVDVLATKDGIKYAIQCKCYSSDLGNSPVQEVNAGKTIYHCHVGVVMTNRFFTSGAKQAAEATGVLLWDRNKLIELVESASKD